MAKLIRFRTDGTKGRLYVCEESTWRGAAARAATRGVVVILGSTGYAFERVEDPDGNTRGVLRFAFPLYGCPGQERHVVARFPWEDSTISGERATQPDGAFEVTR